MTPNQRAFLDALNLAAGIYCIHGAWAQTKERDIVWTLILLFGAVVNFFCVFSGAN